MIAAQLFRSGDRSSSLVQLNIAHKLEQTRTMNCSGDGGEQSWLILSSDMCTACQLLSKILKDLIVGESQAQI